MSAYSDWKCGALSDDDYRWAADREARQDAYYEALYDGRLGHNIDEDAEEPTEKQIAFARKLAEANDLDLDEVPFTKEDYSEFISEWEEWL